MSWTSVWSRRRRQWSRFTYAKPFHIQIQPFPFCVALLNFIRILDKHKTKFLNSTKKSFLQLWNREIFYSFRNLISRCNLFRLPLPSSCFIDFQPIIITLQFFILSIDFLSSSFSRNKFSWKHSCCKKTFYRFSDKLISFESILTNYSLEFLALTDEILVQTHFIGSF